MSIFDKTWASADIIQVAEELQPPTKGTSMNYFKAFVNCQERMAKFATRPLEGTDSTKGWNHNQLLGYLLSHTDEKFQQLQQVEKVQQLDYLEGFCDGPSRETLLRPIPPSRHYMIETMRTILNRECKKDIKEAKAFIDWCLKKYHQKLQVSGLFSLHAKYLAERANKTVVIAPNGRIERSTRLPPHIIEAVGDLAPNGTYGELAFVKQVPTQFDILTQKLQAININVSDLRLEKVV